MNTAEIILGWLLVFAGTFGMGAWTTRFVDSIKRDRANASWREWRRKRGESYVPPDRRF